MAPDVVAADVGPAVGEPAPPGIDSGRVSRTAGSTPLVALDGLTKRYPGGVTALDSLTLSIEPGVVGLVGANGAGKSTLIKILLGLLEASGGSARVFGLDVERQGLAIRQLVGYMPEHDCLPTDISASDFVNHMARMSGLPRASARERSADVLRHVGLFEERYRPMGGYSTGMKQRVKLAQALVHDPRLLLLDEPTNGLDPAGRDEMLDLIRRTGNEFGIAIIMASHLLGEIERVCDHLVAIDAGRLLRSAALDTFTQQTGSLIVEVDDGVTELAERLAGNGHAVRVDGRTRPRRDPRRCHARRRSRRCRGPRPRAHPGRAAAQQPRGPLPRPGASRRERVRRGGCMTAAGLDQPTGNGRGGSIYDLGYRGYEGPRLGRRGAIIALLTHSLRTAYGLGRSARSKILPVGLVLLALLPSLLALGIIALIAQLGAAGEAMEAISPVQYHTLFPFVAVLVFLFCAAQAPELFGRDQRAGVLPLYFSRAVSRMDYAAARTLGLLGSLLVLVLGPQLLLFVGRVLVAEDVLDGLASEAPELPAILGAGLIIVTLVGTISAAIAALTPRRAYATVAVIAIFLIPNIAASLLVRLGTGLLGQVAVLLSPADVLDGVNSWLFGVQPDNVAIWAADLDGQAYLAAAVVWVAGSLLVLGRRYRSIQV